MLKFCNYFYNLNYQKFASLILGRRPKTCGDADSPSVAYQLSGHPCDKPQRAIPTDPRTGQLALLIRQGACRRALHWRRGHPQAARQMGEVDHQRRHGPALSISIIIAESTLFVQSRRTSPIFHLLYQPH